MTAGLDGERIHRDELLLRLANRRLTGWPAWSAAVGTPLLLTLARSTLEPILNGQSGFILYFPGVFLIGLLAGPAPGLTSTILSGLLGYWLFLSGTSPPWFDRDLLTLLMFWCVAGLLLFSVLGMRAAFRRLAERERQLSLAAEREQLLAREMGHRIKNLLTVVHAVVLQSARGAEDLADFRDRVGPRLEALAAAQELALDAVDDVRLSHVVQAALSVVAGRRVHTEGLADCELEAVTARGLVLALHELATNALKYGALSSPEGRVDVCSSGCADGSVTVTWRESGGPPVFPQKPGFGSRLITKALTGAGEGAELDFRADGLRCVFRCRARPVGTTTDTDEPRPSTASGPERPGTSLEPLAGGLTAFEGAPHAT